MTILKEIQKRLAANKLEDGTDIIHFIQDAGRMMLLGDFTGLDRLERVTMKELIADKKDETITEIESIIWDIESPTCVDQIIGLIAALEIYVLTRALPANIFLPSEVHTALDKLITAVSCVEVTRLDEEDEEAYAFLQNYYKQVPYAYEPYKLVSSILKNVDLRPPKPQSTPLTCDFFGLGEIGNRAKTEAELRSQACRVMLGTKAFT